MDWTTLLLQSWAPPLITIVAGGAFASLLIPRLQAGYNRSKLFEQKRMEAMERIAEVFPAYIASWRRLIALAEEERRAGESPERIVKLKYEIAGRRNERRDELAATIARARLYFSATFAAEARTFLDWDEGHSRSSLDALPPLSEWRAWEDRLLTQMRDEALPKRGTR